MDENYRVQERYDNLMAEGKHGHYETLFCIVREETEIARQDGKLEAAEHILQMWHQPWV